MKKIILFLMLCLLLVSCAIENDTNPIETQSGQNNTNQTETDIVEPNSIDFILPKVVEEDGASTIYFEYIPSNKEELEMMCDFTNPKLTTALLLISLRHYIEDPKVGIEMLNVLHGPEPLSDYDIDFLEERFSDKPYLPNSYFNGSSVENDYTPDLPLSVTLYDDELAPIEGYLRIFVYSSGADNIRYLQLRAKKDEYYIWEFPGIVVGIKTPASLDPWA